MRRNKKKLSNIFKKIKLIFVFNIKIKGNMKLK